MEHKHQYNFNEDTNVFTLDLLGEVTLENVVAFMTEAVMHRKFPDQILILQDLSKATILMSLTEVHILEAFQRKYIDNFDFVKLAIVLPKEVKEVSVSLYYEGITSSPNCETKVFDLVDTANRWLLG